MQSGFIFRKKLLNGDVIGYSMIMRKVSKVGLIISLAVGSVCLSSAAPLGLIEKLGDEEYATRTKAHEDLLEWAREEAGKKDIDALKEKLRTTDSPEIKLRLEDIIEDSQFEAELGTRGFVGITMLPHPEGVGVQFVQPGSPAEKAGVKKGDVFIEIDDENLADLAAGNQEVAMNFFSTYVKKKKAGQRLDFKIKRGDEAVEGLLKLADYNVFNKLLEAQGALEGRKKMLDKEIQEEIKKLQQRQLELRRPPLPQPKQK